MSTVAIPIGSTIEGRFLERANRFLVIVELCGRRVPCHLPNPGRMQELLHPGVTMLLKEVRSKVRKTSYDVIGLLHQGHRISIDTRVPNRLLCEALERRVLPEFAMYNVVVPEFRYGASRIDFWLTNDSEECLLEVKSCTLVEKNRALFPDAVTERGRKHILHLIDARRQGYRACVLFLVQRTDAHVFSPNDSTDPRFGEALRMAFKEGVEVYALSSELVQDRIILGDWVEVDLGQ